MTRLAVTAPIPRRDIKRTSVVRMKAGAAITLDAADRDAGGCSLNVGSRGAQRLINVRVEAQNPPAHPI